MRSKQKEPENIGVANPFALAEILIGKKVNWNKIANPKELLEKTLGMPYEKLFDPKFESPLYAGLKLDEKTKTMKKVEITSSSDKAARVLLDVRDTTVWVDPGDFFEEGTEMTDPVQGGLGDCYYIAALSSVAWARPYVIAQRNRATGTKQGNFTDMIEFYKSNNAEKIEVTELLPLKSPGNSYIYARSSEAGEIWPAVYEKAYAKWRTNDTSDKPNYAPIAGGDPVGALEQLTNLQRYYYWNTAMSSHDIWQKIRANSISFKTFNPMVAWTYSTSPSPDVNYATAHIAANHAYSILGWHYENNEEFIVLRNPWGWYEAVLGIDTGNWVVWDAPYYSGKGYWRSVPLSNQGIFALKSDIFKKYFAGFGLVKTPESP